MTYNKYIYLICLFVSEVYVCFDQSGVFTKQNICDEIANCISEADELPCGMTFFNRLIVYYYLECKFRYYKEQ